MQLKIQSQELDPGILNKIASTDSLSLYNGKQIISSSKAQIALIGLELQSYTRFQSKFYQLDFDWIHDLNVLDIGVLTESEPFQIVQTTLDLIESNIVPVIIGSTQAHISELITIQDKILDPYRLALIEKNATAVSGLLNTSDLVALKDIYLIGHQRQYGHYLDCEELTAISIGDFRSQSSFTEPALRSTDFVAIHLDAVKYSDSPASFSPCAAGFTAEEMFQLSKMIGNGDRLRALFIHEWNDTLPSADITVDLVANMVWYFLEGYALKIIDNLNSKSKLKHFVVQSDRYQFNLNFFKSELSGKWWIEEVHPSGGATKRMIPCTYDEYKYTVQNELPDRLIDQVLGV